ncbi:hypothetical protein K492DRAFT_211595 [Lichtheimia hyalospora FSU 10163]|nr:hypothetical protein K492DRAFT_211595 [Lichtheimia hyalospora FSU 10163]
MTGALYTQVTKENFDSVYQEIVDKIATAKYVAIDTEFTGHCQTFPKHMDQRYSEIANVVGKNAMVSFGMSIKNQNGTTDNYDVLVVNETVHQVNPSNLLFLVHHGFDFNRQLRYGLGYRPGIYNVLNRPKDIKVKKSVRELWVDIHRKLRAHLVPLVVHNGFIDLMYLYHSFITVLPTQFQHFVADLVDAFPGGIYDTKYLSRSVLNEEVTFLAYLYYRFMRQNNKRKREPKDIDQATPCKKPRDQDPLEMSPPPICDEYAARGYCQGGYQCAFSHDLNKILERDEGIRYGVNKENVPVPVPVASMHNAYFDALMTGYVFNQVSTLLGKAALEEHNNKLYLMRLDFPLRLVKSHYTNITEEWSLMKKHIDDGGNE